MKEEFITFDTVTDSPVLVKVSSIICVKRVPSGDFRQTKEIYGIIYEEGGPDFLL